MQPPHRPALRHKVALAALITGVAGVAGLAGVAGCRTQRYPDPMDSLVEPLPRGDLLPYSPGPEEVQVYRHADPVLVRPAENRNAYPLAFYNNQTRLLSGGWLIVGPGGRGELLWPKTGTSVIVFDNTAAVIGEPSRGEPTLTLRYLTRVRLDLARDAVVRLPGGALLYGEPTDDLVNGPYHLEMIRHHILRVKNKSHVSSTVRYLDEEILLGPDDLVDLVVLDTGTAPEEPWPGVIEFVSGPMVARVQGEVEQLPSDFGLALVAHERSEVQALGVHLTLAAGDRAQFLGLGDLTPEVTWATPLEVGPRYGEESAAMAGGTLDPREAPAQPLPDSAVDDHAPPTPAPPPGPGMAGQEPPVPR